MRLPQVGITVVKRVPAPFSPEWVRGIIASTLSVAGHRASAEVGVVFAGNAEMRKLNRHYRGMDASTDVLSFEGEDGNLGDLIVSVPFARAQAKAGERSLRREVADLLIHGTLHLLGHDHMKKGEAARMFKLQDAVMRTCGFGPIEDKKRP